jgi:hypothetical protein
MIIVISVATAAFEKRASYTYLLTGSRGALRPSREIILKQFYKNSSKCNLPLGGMTCNLEQNVAEL